MSLSSAGASRPVWLQILVGLVDRAQKFVEVRRFLHRPNPVERRTKVFQVAACKKADGYNPIRHRHTLD